MYIIIKICFYEKLIIPVAKVPVIYMYTMYVSILFENVIHILLDSADFLIQIHITFASFSRYCLLIHIVIFYILQYIVLYPPCPVIIDYGCFSAMFMQIKMCFIHCIQVNWLVVHVPYLFSCLFNIERHTHFLQFGQ